MIAWIALTPANAVSKDARLELRLSGSSVKREVRASWFAKAGTTVEMIHPIHKVTGFEIVADYTLRVCFEDKTEQVIDFRPILAGEMFGPLWDLSLFNRVRIDPEAHTLVWPTDVDLDPATLHDWPLHGLVTAAPTRHPVVPLNDILEELGRDRDER